MVRDHLTTPFDAAFDRVAHARGVPSNLLRALARHESNFRPDAVGPLNANNTRDYGLMQINEKTAAKYNVTPAQLLANPELSIDVAARTLVDMRHALGDRFSAYTWPMAYNVGPDLEPRAVGESYASKVFWHWNLYDVGRLFA